MEAENIDGWMDGDDLTYLRNKASQSNCVLEVGCWKGRSTYALAKACLGVVHAVDWFLGSPKDGDSVVSSIDCARTAREEFFRNVEEFIREGKMIIHVGDSRKVLASLGGLQVDFAYIDGDHSYESVHHDITGVKPLVCPGGIIAGHDLPWNDVRRAVEELCPGYRGVTGTTWEWVKDVSGL